MTLGQTVRKHRLEARIFQEELGTKVGLSRQSIMTIEQGGGTSFENAKKLSLALGFSLDPLTLE